jgi:hypothetical protein
MVLGVVVELYHGVGEGVSVVSKGWATLHHSSVEGAIDLSKGVWAWEVHVDERAMSQESV